MITHKLTSHWSKKERHGLPHVRSQPFTKIHRTATTIHTLFIFIFNLFSYSSSFLVSDFSRSKFKKKTESEPNRIKPESKPITKCPGLI